MPLVSVASIALPLADANLFYAFHQSLRLRRFWRRRGLAFYMVYYVVYAVLWLTCAEVSVIASCAQLP